MATEIEEITLPELSWTVIRVGKLPGGIYVKTKFGYWLEVSSGHDVSDKQLTAMVNEPAITFEGGYRRAATGYVVLDEILVTP